MPSAQADARGDQITAALSVYSHADACDLDFPFAATTHYVQTVGKHLMAPEVLAGLYGVRAGLGPGLKLTRGYLDCILDKYDGRYRYDTYIALPVLLPAVSGDARRLTPTRLAGLLIADAVRFELSALHERHSVMPGSRPPVAVVRKRLRHAVRFALQWAYEPGEAAGGHGELLAWAEECERPVAADRLLTALPEPPHPDTALRIAASVLPVDRLHDEYLFIRVLQSHEAVFSVLVQHLQRAISHLQRRDAAAVCAEIGAASEMIRQAGSLFTILASMSADSFRIFRQLTEGASAIQSEQYKTLELLCGMPRAERLRSAAFDNVSNVQHNARRDPVTLTGIYRLARAQDWFGAAEQHAVDMALIGLEAAHQRWKTTHFRIAERMLGDARGSGYTAGVPYLKDVLDNRLFWAIPELSRPGGGEGP